MGRGIMTKTRQSKLISGLLFAAVSAAATDNEAVFRDKLQPLLTRHCSSCHSGKATQGNLAVSSLDSLLAGGKRGPAILPGNSRQSLLMAFVRGEKGPKMPLGGALPDAEIQEIASAIDSMSAGQNSTALKADAHREWIFRKPAERIVPKVTRPDWVRNPVDAFVLARLEAGGLSPAPPAGRRALIRRAYFSVIGLPPSPEEIEAFERDNTPDAYEKVIDKLLAGPRYGERWGRHWLDLARFGESDGFAIDGERPTAWRYRDYVIRAFNADKPYNEFIKEQLAGDEGRRAARQIASAPSDSLLATGFLRMGPWEADANFDDQLRLDFLNEVTSTTSQVFLGLTVGCARCHDHKYDPISQRDFYRMQSFFAATRVDEPPAPFVKTEDPVVMRKLARQYEDELDSIAERFRSIEQQLRLKYAEAKKLPAGSPAIDEFQRVLNDKKDLFYTSEERTKYEFLRDRTRRVTELLARHQPVAYAVSEVAPPFILEVAPTHVLGGGDLKAKGALVEPGFLTCVTGKEEAAKIPFVGRRRTGRRTALADWIASPDNPLTARVMVNRIWQHHVGEGIVRTPSDFGMNGDRPSHQELLDWLATQFVETNWSIKAMHRLILTSNTYRQSTAHPDWKAYSEKDPDNRLLWRMNWQRLEGEVIRDSMLAVSGRLQLTAGGPGVFFDISRDMAEGFSFFKWYPSEEKEKLRRTVYHFQRRSVMMPMMEVFDGANMSESCSRRGATTVPPQAFALLNGETTHTEARHFAKRVIALAGDDTNRQIDRAFRLALGRAPEKEETSHARELYAIRSHEDALTRLGVVLFNLNEFLQLE